jgi:hypothetical protein
MQVSAGYVFLAAMATAVTTGLGALPLVGVKEFSRWWLGIANAAAGGSCWERAIIS